MKTKPDFQFEKFLNIGFIQTVLDQELAWFSPSKNRWNVPMSPVAEHKMWQEIKQGFVDLLTDHERANIIILPEVTLPLGYENHIKKLCIESNSVVIDGLDFDKTSKGIRNRALVIVPNRWPSQLKSTKTTTYYFGKTHFSQSEKDLFEDMGLKEYPDPTMYLFDADIYGKIGVAICSDFFDLERFIIYRGQIQTLIVIAHNKDTESYYFLTEAIARLVYCNVIICNTGHYGDSIAYSPYKEPFNRYIYRHRGQGLFATQVVKIPIESLIESQRRYLSKTSYFKSPPPGYQFKNFIHSRAIERNIQEIPIANPDQ